jgi:hypothetical protein
VLVTTYLTPPLFAPQEEELGSSSSRSTRHRRETVSRVDRRAARRALRLRVHPLFVEVMLRLPDGSSVQLSFAHLTMLNIITVQARVEAAQAVHGVAAG